LLGIALPPRPGTFRAPIGRAEYRESLSQKNDLTTSSIASSALMSPTLVPSGEFAGELHPSCLVPALAVDRVEREGGKPCLRHLYWGPFWPS
jgi:hypothetical protein